MYNVKASPLPFGYRTKRTAHPFAGLAIGDALLVAHDRPQSYRMSLHTTAREWAARRHLRWQFATRVIGGKVELRRIA